MRTHADSLLRAGPPVAFAQSVSPFVRIVYDKVTVPDITAGFFATVGDSVRVEPFRTYVPAFAVNGRKSRPSSSWVAPSLGTGLALNP